MFMINNKNDLNKFIKQQIIPKAKVAMDESIMPEARDIYKKHVETEIYSSYEPVQYDRTEQFLDSSAYTDAEVNGNSVSSEIYHDDTQHFSIVTGEDVDPNVLSDWLNNGEIGNPFGADPNSPWLRATRHKDQTKEELDKKLPRMIKKAFKQQGLDVK